MHYRIAPPPDAGAAQLLRQTLAWLKQDRAMQADRARLGKACCSPAKFLTLQSAPHPTSVARSRKAR
jgi:ArsR family transcriptional regulator